MNTNGPAHGSAPAVGRDTACRAPEQRGVGPGFEWEARCAAVIPCLDEEQAIAPLVKAVRRHLKTVLVVDDGSRDETGRLATESGAELLRHSEPLGKGAALRSGWAWAMERGFDWALCLDGDGQHSAEDIPAFFQCAQRGAASLIVGNRMLNPDAMPPMRRYVNRWLSRRISKAAGRSLPDSQCGFRLMNLRVWKALGGSLTEHFEIESEVVLSFALAGEGVEFVPIRALYKGEQSKIHPVRDTWRWFRWWRRRRQMGRMRVEGGGAFGCSADDSDQAG